MNIEAGRTGLKLRFKLPRKTMAGENLDSTADLSRSLIPWQGKARRTMRREVSPPPRVPSSEHQNRSPQAVIISGKCKLEETDQNGSVEKSQKTDSASMDYPIISSGANHDGESGVSEIQSNSIDEISVGTKSNSSNKRCTDESEDQVTSVVLPKIYACSFCSKTFSSHLALGGHKSSHNKFQMIIYNAIDLRRRKRPSMITNACHQQPREDRHNASNPESVGDDDRTHTCKICFKKFSSGQALGGHQRRHWTGNMPDRRPEIRYTLDFHSGSEKSISHIRGHTFGTTLDHQCRQHGPK
ncbi:hypothetical protein F511_42098 [Dorcoceras hygrometricum]|uniref:C2H2-type domain-containing protein n=1 Tax=Dorcoceras hygrometricum TaxID=472368 RepID=A0A2Z7A239_9LAMI|nr:hypothetical protein F511_42098 [Dorcoceras hygrometricum]